MCCNVFEFHFAVSFGKGGSMGLIPRYFLVVVVVVVLLLLLEDYGSDFNDI